MRYGSGVSHLLHVSTVRELTSDEKDFARAMASRLRDNASSDQDTRLSKALDKVGGNSSDWNDGAVATPREETPHRLLATRTGERHRDEAAYDEWLQDNEAMLAETYGEHWHLHDRETFGEFCRKAFDSEFPPEETSPSDEEQPVRTFYL